MKKVIILVVLLALSGCVGLTDGRISGKRTGREVARQLTAGMTVQEIQTALADGGALSPATFFVRNGEGSFAPQEHDQAKLGHFALHGFKSLTEENRGRVQSIMRQPRGQGFFGYDVFYLYLDGERKLVAFVQDHFN